MAAVNEAYRVLADPARRAVYDRGLAGGDSTATAQGSGSAGWSSSTPVPPATMPPARIPWRFLTFFAAAAAVFVFTASLLFEPSPERGPNGVIGAGSCVEVLANNDVREVRCSGDARQDLVVEALVPYDERCPGTTVPYRDSLGRGYACVRSTPGP